MNFPNFSAKTYAYMLFPDSIRHWVLQISATPATFPEGILPLPYLIVTCEWGLWRIGEKSFDDFFHEEETFSLFAKGD